MLAPTLLAALLSSSSLLAALATTTKGPAVHNATRNLNTYSIPAPTYLQALTSFHSIRAIYDQVLYPANIPILEHGASAVPAGLFNANATGRVSPLGNFTSFADSIEYFFALNPAPSAPYYSAFTNVTVADFSSGCPRVAASVAYLTQRVWHPDAPDDGDYVVTVKQV